EALVVARETHGEHALGEAITCAERFFREAIGTEGLGKRAHHLRLDHLAADAGQTPARKIEIEGTFRHGRDAARAKLVTERRRIADRGAVLAENLEPRERAAREVFGGEEIDRGLAGQSAQNEPDEPHVVE